MTHQPNIETIRRICYLFKVTECKLLVDDKKNTLLANIPTDKKTAFQQSLKDWSGEDYTVIKLTPKTTQSIMLSKTYTTIMPVSKDAGINDMQQRLK